MTSLSLFPFMHWRRKWQPTPVFLPGESQGRGSLVGFLLWGHTESDTTEVTYKEIEENNRMGKTRDLYKKIRDTKGTFHAKMGSIKDRNDMDLRETEDIKKGWQEYTEELYKKDLHNTDNHDDVIIHLEPDILECEVKWALGSITRNKASGDDGIPVELFQILKDDAVKCCTQYTSKFGKLRRGHRTGKGQCLFQSERKATPKKAQSTTQLHSSHMLVK